MLNIETLLKNKGVIEEKTGEKTMTIEVKSFKEQFGDGEITIKSIDMNKMHDLGSMAGDNEYKMTTIVVYNAVVEPNLKDKELQKAYDCKSNPFKIVEKLFQPKEIKAISDKVAELSGIGNEKDIVKEIKK